MDAGAANQEGGGKRSLDEFTKEELVTKCKGLLGIAQKAKLAKTELQHELESLKLQLEKCETEKNASKDNVRTLQELVESLTEQKLNYITELDSAENKVRALDGKCHSYEQEIEKCKADFILKDKHVLEVTQSLSSIDTELVSLKRQNHRLLEENEQLINQLTELESRTAEFNKIGLQQMEQLQVLEERVSIDDTYKTKIEELNNTIKELEGKLNAPTEAAKYEQQIKEYEQKIKEVSEKYELEKSKKEKVNIKLKSYKDKILKCAACINQLKNSRFILTKTIKEYSDNIPKWQNDIINASKLVDRQINDLNEENKILKGKLSQLQQHVNVPESEVDIEVYKSKISELHEENKANIALISNLQKQADEFKNSNDALVTELSEFKLMYQDLHDIQLPAHTDENKHLKEQLNDATLKITSILNENKSLHLTTKDMEDQIQTLKQSLQNKIPSDELIEKLKLQIKALESEKAMIVKEKFGAKDNVLDLENQNKILNDQVNSSRSEIMMLNTQIQHLTEENSNNKMVKDGEINKLMTEIKSIQAQYDSLKKEHDDLQDLNGLLREEVETLKLSLEQPNDDNDNISDLNASLQADIVKLEMKLNSCKQENAVLHAEVKESRTKIKEFDSLVSNYEEAKSKLAGYKTENTELLNEMKEINQVLKERGEAISKLQKAVAEMERLVESLEKEKDSLKQENKDLLQQIDGLKNNLKSAEHESTQIIEASKKNISERDDALKSLAEKESVIASLKEEIEKLKQQSSSELPNEDMSTSTISTAEDHARMKDLDESFEDKYTKLRSFAMKLKKKLNDTTAQLLNVEEDKAKLEKLLNENGGGDKIMPSPASGDEVDGRKHTVDVNTAKLLEVSQKDLSATVEAKVQMSAELENVKAELSSKIKELAAEIESHKATKESLEKAKRDAKSKNILSLEIEDYERSMKELTIKMEDNKKKIVQMESTIDTQEGTITAMKTQIKLLEEQIKAEENINRTMKEELQQVIDEGKEKDNVVAMKNEIINKLEQDLEDEKRKYEEAELEMTSVLSEKEKVILKLSEEKAELNNRLKKMEIKYAEVDEKLKIADTELADLKTEYTSYKVRAQAVLRQNQTVDHSQEEQLKEETAALRAQIEALTAQLTTLQEECTDLSQEAESRGRRASEAASEAARAQQRTAWLQADLAHIGQQLDSERAQHKLQISTLTQCYKTQITELETKLQRETEALRKQLSAQQTAPVRRSSLDAANHNYMLPVIPKDDGSDGEMDINVSMIPREEGEGSESAPTPPPWKPLGAGGSRSPVPLDRLLEQGVPDDEDRDPAALALTPDQELADLRRKLHAQQQRVKHVTVLLSESERECARMGQLAELLKAELRRVRGASANPNTEYMKNVTLKFLTLPPGDERCRLVPVLHKILTLTADEMQKINAVAKGQDPNASKGWGSYLPWPGGK